MPDLHQPSTFGPTALATPANALTLGRLLITPLVVILVVLRGPGWLPFALVALLSATDSLDGIIARRQGTTRSGVFLDPLADKAVVLSLLFTLAAIGELSWLPVSLIAARELGMTLYRIAASRRQISIPARPSAKLKTLVQLLVILLALAPPTATHPLLLSLALWIAVVFTLFTALEYFFDARRTSLHHT